MDSLTKLKIIEEDIEKLYLYLIHLEISGQRQSDDYRIIMQKIDGLTKEESSLLINIQDNYVDIKRKIQSDISHNFPIYLGFSTQASTLRLQNLFDSICGDPGIEYADALNYDIHRILLKFLECMIDNPYYEEIRRDLIYFKYDIIFLDYKLESDFLLENDLTRIPLEARLLQDDLPSHKYIEQSILVWEIEEAIKQIECINNVSERASSHVLVIIKMMQIFARMALCSEKQLNYVMDDVHYLMENTEVDSQIKEIMIEVAEIFEQIQSSFYFSR